jgi:hypothetical protein
MALCESSSLRRPPVMALCESSSLAVTSDGFIRKLNLVVTSDGFPACSFLLLLFGAHYLLFIIYEMW